MDEGSIRSVRRGQLATVAVILGVLVLSDPLVGAVDLAPEHRGAAELGDGTANATVVGDPASGLVIEPGRFGTNVSYLRVPAVTVDVNRVEGRPRLLYLVRVPRLDFQRSVTHSLDEGGEGRHVMEMDDRAFTHAAIRNDSYRATVVVKVQSFEGTWTIYRHNATVSVRG